MFEINSKKRDRKKDILQLIVIVIVVEILIYFITVFFAAPMEVFYALTGLILLVLSMGMAVLSPQRFIIDEEREIVGLCFKKLCVSRLHPKSFNWIFLFS